MKRPDDRPRHLQIAADLRAKILSGDLTESLPSFNKLSAMYKTSNNTAQRAIQLLKAEGLVEGRQGKGLILCTNHLRVINAAPYLDPRVTLIRYEILHVGPGRPPADAAAMLGLAHKEKAILRKRLMRGYDSPIELSWSYYPTEIAAGTPLDKPRHIPGGAPAALAALGYRQHKFTDVIQIRQPTSEELTLLKLPAAVPVTRTLRTVTDAADKALEVTVIVKGGHLYGMRYSQTLGPIRPAE